MIIKTAIKNETSLAPTPWYALNICKENLISALMSAEKQLFVQNNELDVYDTVLWA